jgi:lysophospholipid acyltransferase
MLGLFACSLSLCIITICVSIYFEFVCENQVQWNKPSNGFEIWEIEDCCRKGLEMESMAATIGVSVPVLRFLLCFVVMIPVSFIHRFVLSPFGKHLYAALSGAFLSYLSSGFSSNLHFLVSMLLGYLSMVLLLWNPWVFIGVLTVMFFCHIYKPLWYFWQNDYECFLNNFSC